MTDNIQNDGPEHAAESTSNGFLLSAKWYNRLKWFTIVFLPAFGAFYFGLSKLVPAVAYAEEVLGITALLATFIGLLIGKSNSNFKKSGADGSIGAYIEGDNVVLSRLALPNITAEELAGRKSVTIQVNSSRGPSQ